MHKTDIYISTAYTSGVSRKEMSDIAATINEKLNKTTSYYVPGTVYEKPSSEECLLLIKDDKIDTGWDNYSAVTVGRGVYNEINSFLDSYLDKRIAINVLNIKTGETYIVESAVIYDKDDYQSGCIIHIEKRDNPDIRALVIASNDDNFLEDLLLLL